MPLPPSPPIPPPSMAAPPASAAGLNSPPMPQLGPPFLSTSPQGAPAAALPPCSSPPLQQPVSSSPPPRQSPPLQQPGASPGPALPPAAAPGDAAAANLPPLAPTSASRSALPKMTSRARLNQVAPLSELAASPPSSPALRKPVLPAIPSRTAAKLGAPVPQAGSTPAGQGQQVTGGGAAHPVDGQQASAPAIASGPGYEPGVDLEPDAQVGPPTDPGVITKSLLQNLPPGVAIGPTADSHIHDVWA